MKPISRSFRLSKTKNLNFIDEVLKRKNNIPGPMYDIAKADKWLSTKIGKSYKWLKINLGNNYHLLLPLFISVDAMYIIENDMKSIQAPMNALAMKQWFILCT